MSQPVTTEISRWSELPSFIESYNQQVAEKGGGVGRIFGYASIIGNHSAEKPEKSTGLPNEKAKLNGMEVAMNVYAAGQYELRGTRDLENGVYNVGLYAGMEPALTEDGYAEGLNITVAPEDAAQSFKAYLKREIGNTPDGIALDDLITQGENTGEIKVTEAGHRYFASLEGTDKDEFGLYKLQVANVTREDGKEVPALSVSTNENSPFSAIGLTPRQAAHYILDGQGYEREMDGRTLGGSAVDYFKNTLASYEEYDVEQPRMREIAGAVIGMAEAYREFHSASQDPAKQGQMAEIASRLLDENFTQEVNGQKHFVATRRFEDDLINRGEAPNTVKQANSLPQTAEEKMGRISELLDGTALDEVKKVAEELDQLKVRHSKDAGTKTPTATAPNTAKQRSHGDIPQR